MKYLLLAMLVVLGGCSGELENKHYDGSKTVVDDYGIVHSYDKHGNKEF